MSKKMKKMETVRRITLLWAGIAMMLIALPVWAIAADSTGTKKSELDDIVVTATRSEGKAIDIPAHVEIISQKMIEMSGAINLGDLIGKFTTGHLHKYNGVLTSVGIRGFRTESHGDDLKGYVLLLVDGHRVGTGNAAKINVDRIERVEVIKGPASALYGSAAMGGVINVITKKGAGNLETKITQEVGSFDYLKTSVTSGGSLNEKFGYHLSASYSDIDDYDDPEYGTVYNSWVTEKRAGGNITFDPSESHMFRVGFDYADIEGASPGWKDDVYSSWDDETKSGYDKSHGYADLEYNGSFMDDKLKWRAMAYYLWDRNHWMYGSPDPNDSQSKYTDETLGTDQQLTYQITPANELIIGGTLERLEKESEGVTGGLPSLPYTPGMEYETQSLFIQDSMDFMDNRLNVVLAGRYDNFDLTTKHPSTGELVSINERTESFDHFSPKAGVSMKFFEEMFRVRTNVGVGFKSPSADQLSAMYVQESWGSIKRYLGNPDLDPETSFTWDLGFDLALGATDIGVTWFNTDYEDKIVSDTTEYLGQTWNTWKNSGDATFQGIDVNVNIDVSEVFDLQPDITVYSNVTFNTEFEDEETGEDLLYISDYEIKSGIQVNHGPFGGTLSHVLVGPQMITNYDTNMTVEKGSFSFWDLSLKYQFLERFEAKLNVLNVFDQTYEWVRGYIMPERTFNFAISCAF